MIKPYHKLLEAKAYVLEVDNITTLSLGETIGLGTNERFSRNSNHLNG